MLILFLTTALLNYGQASQTNNKDSVLVDINTIKNSYEKLVERKAQLEYIDSLESEVIKLQSALKEIKALYNENKELYTKIGEIQEEKYDIAMNMVKSKKVGIVFGGGTSYSLTNKSISLNAQAGLIFKQKTIVTGMFGINNKGGLNVGANVLINSL